MNNGTSEYLGELMRKQLAKAGLADPVAVSLWQEKASKMTLDEFVEDAQKLGIDITPIEEFAKTAKITVLENATPMSSIVSDEIKQAIRPILADSKGYSLFKTKMPLTYSQCKRALRELLEGELNANPNEEPEKLVYPFIISHQKAMKGQVLSNLDSAKKSVNLLLVYSVRGQFHYQFFGEPKPYELKREAPIMRYNALFYIYRFVDDETTEEAILLSDKALELTSCRITGMEAPCYDFLKVGNMARINTTTKVFFVAEQEPEIDRIDEKEFQRIAAQYKGEEKIHKTFFGNFPHPPWFSRFLISWLLSGKLSNMPTHLSLLSPPSSGKTYILKGFSRVFKQPIIGGGTIKGLVPSFANGVPNEGKLIKSKRIALIDEFIHIIQYSSRSTAGGDFDGGSYQLLKVLEHTEDEYVSAFGTIRAKPKMWSLFVSNIKPHEHISNLVDLHSKLNVAFMSRLLWYIYDENHVNFINATKKEVMKYDDEKDLPAFNPEINAMVDYLHARTIDIPSEVAEAIHSKYKEFVPASLIGDVYDSRMIMHIYRLLDGYAKYKSIMEGRDSLRLEPQDISEVDELFGRIVRSWSYGLPDTELPPRMRVEYLTPVQRQVYEQIAGNPGCNVYDLENALKADAKPIVDVLIKKGIVRTVLGLGNQYTFYAYTSTI